ncbi:hypothetical protein CC80DRAFT_548077 [Byssothecium circinans]|uniref:Uncharacterized protein n=1 Tax=Byssothecium circinans TaxID=147558 RepID=A0A6A5TXZ4_9PLEO|nr:hypothetical protein CC80DRAFT_548077 [Byssothecium circinans]
MPQAEEQQSSYNTGLDFAGSIALCDRHYTLRQTPTDLNHVNEAFGSSANSPSLPRAPLPSDSESEITLSAFPPLPNAQSIRPSSKVFHENDINSGAEYTAIDETTDELLQNKAYQMLHATWRKRPRASSEQSPEASSKRKGPNTRDDAAAIFPWNGNLINMSGEDSIRDADTLGVDEEIMRQMLEELGDGQRLRGYTIHTILIRLLPPDICICEYDDLLDDLASWKPQLPHWHDNMARFAATLVFNSFLESREVSVRIATKWSSAFPPCGNGIDAASAVFCNRLPTQTDSSNCGIFAVSFLLQAAILGDNVTADFSTPKVDTRLWRRHFCHLLGSQRLDAQTWVDIYIMSAAETGLFGLSV